MKRRVTLFALLSVSGLIRANNAFDIHCPKSNKVRQISKEASGKLGDEKQMDIIEDINDILLLLKKDFANLQTADSKKLYQNCYNSYFTSGHNLIHKAPFSLQKNQRFNELVGDYFYLDGDMDKALIHFEKSETLGNERYQLQYKIITSIAQILKDPNLSSSRMRTYAIRIKKIYKTLIYSKTIPESERRKFARNFWYLEK